MYCTSTQNQSIFFFFYITIKTSLSLVFIYIIFIYIIIYMVKHTPPQLMLRKTERKNQTPTTKIFWLKKEKHTREMKMEVVMHIYIVSKVESEA